MVVTRALASLDIPELIAQILMNAPLGLTIVLLKATAKICLVHLHASALQESRVMA